MSRPGRGPNIHDPRYPSMSESQHHYSNPIINMPISTISSMSTAHGGSSASPTNGGFRSVDPRNLSFDKTESTIENIIVRQLNEDIQAYKIDLDFCDGQMKASDVTPQEMRTLQLRVLDLTHSLRHSKHRIELLQFEISSGTTATNGSASASLGKALACAQTSDAAFGSFPRPQAVAVKRPGVDLSTATIHSKRTRIVDMSMSMSGSMGTSNAVVTDTSGPGEGMDGTASMPGRNSNSVKVDGSQQRDEMQDALLDGNNGLQRLGYWECRLCNSQKFMTAKNSRQRAGSCKRPLILKDIAKMITHFTELHTEHTPSERCVELGAALDRNRGPFQYWLTRSHSQNLNDETAINNMIDTLLSGRLPNMLRKLSRAAASFPMQEHQECM